MPVIRPSPRHVRLLLVAILALGGVGGASGACSLNPQPIPPGFESDAAFGGAPENGGQDPDQKGDTSSGDASFADSAGGGLTDSGTSSDAPGTVPAVDGGTDAADAADAADAIADAADDG